MERTTSGLAARRHAQDTAQRVETKVQAGPRSCHTATTTTTVALSGSSRFSNNFTTKDK